MATSNVTMDGTWKELGTGKTVFQLRNATTPSLEWLTTSSGRDDAGVSALNLQGLIQPVSAGATGALVWDSGAEAIYARAKDGVLVVT